jgi:hypothetical protein
MNNWKSFEVERLNEGYVVTVSVYEPPYWGTTFTSGTYTLRTRTISELRRAFESAVGLFAYLIDLMAEIPKDEFLKGIEDAWAVQNKS